MISHFSKRDPEYICTYLFRLYHVVHPVDNSVNPLPFSSVMYIDIRDLLKCWINAIFFAIYILWYCDCLFSSHMLIVQWHILSWLIWDNLSFNSLHLFILPPSSSEGYVFILVGWLVGCLSACLSVCLSVCIYTCMSACMTVNNITDPSPKATVFAYNHFFRMNNEINLVWIMALQHVRWTYPCRD